MNGIGRSLNGLNAASNESKTLNVMIDNTSILAENVSAKVRRLDEARVCFPDIPHFSAHFLDGIFLFLCGLATRFRMPATGTRSYRFAVVFTRCNSGHQIRGL